MNAQLEIVIRVKGRFIKKQNVVVNGEIIGTLTKLPKSTLWNFDCIPGKTLFTGRQFANRDDACSWLFDRYTSEPTSGPFSLTGWREFDRQIDAQYRETDDYLMRANAPDYHSWLDNLDAQECA